MIPSRQTDYVLQSHRAGKRFPGLLGFMLIAIAYSIAVWLGLLFVIQPEGIASIWPPSGVGLAVLLLNEGRRWAILLFVMLLINIVGN